MSYSDTTIQQMVNKISNNEIYLPALQRRFVWSYEQIEKLFDSIMLGYPIGTFLFWGVEKSKANDYVFYKFIQEYHERDRFLNELAPKPEMKDRIIGVLDGQQRLSSMYLALQGSYAYKKPRARWDNDDAFPKRHLYLNLYKNDAEEAEDNTYDFKFLTETEATIINDKHFWFPVKDALLWKDATDYINYATKKNLLSNPICIQNLTLLWQRITQDKIINYFEVQSEELDDVLDIFIRVNSGGTILSKSDLLFSTIVANWEKAREEIEDLLKCINNKGDKFDFDNDFIMRLCLVLTDSPILFQVRNFKKENIMKIKDRWEDIKEAIKSTVDLLVEFGFNTENLTSKNVAVPIAYHIYKGGKLDVNDKIKIKKYLITSLLKFIYGGKGDQVLEVIRNAMRKEEKENDDYVLKTLNFPLETLMKTKLPADKSLIFTNEDIEGLFEHKKSPYTFMVLSLLYPNLKLNQIKFHQDHLHPSAAFKNVNLKNNNIHQDKWSTWQNEKDCLANLQLLEGNENEIKNETSLIDWYNNSVVDKVSYKLTNYIPENIDLSLSNFEQFIEERKKLMAYRFKQIIS